MTVESAKSSPQAQTISALRRALPQILAVSVKNVLLFVFGMSLGFPTILIPNLSGGDPDEKIVLGVDAISWIGSVNLLCVPLGCFLSGYVTQPFGRRRSMQFVTVPFLAAWLIFQYATEPWHVFLALCITGFSGGLLEAPTLTYLAEVTTPNLRGVLAATSSVSVIVGILAQFLLGTFLHWRSVALASSVLPIVACALLFFVPESPYWLVMKNRQTDAQKSIAWLRGWLPVDDVLIEYKEFYEQLNKNKTKRESSQGPQGEVSALAKIKENLKLFTKKNFLWPFGLVTLTFGVGHFSGMTPLQTYAVKIFATFNVPINKYYATIILGVAEALGCILSSILVHFVGKRRMNFFSLLGTGCCFFVVATYAQTINVKFLEASHLETKIGPQLEGQSWVPMIFLIGAAFFSHTGIRILPWMLIGEVYYSDIRATASGFSAAASYILGFIANKIFFSMISFLTLPGTFWFYTAVALLGVISLYYWLPETEGKTLFQITEHFSGGEQLDNKVSNFLRLRKLQKKQQALDGGGKGVENAAFDEEPAKRCEVLDVRL
uniref:Major facilitator superfamily (MFS) profile domain-containing protein n=1 Tax=Dendroctonus ponderosae TaxID=77166 RepID=A0AAR5PL19_DENPD